MYLFIRLISFLSIVFITLNVNAQFVEQFSDGGFNSNPNWNGTEDQFSVNTENTLVLAGDVDAGAAYLSTASTLSENVSYEFYLKLNFQPSTQDFVRIYLMSNNEDLSSNNQAYLLQINEQNSLQFVRQNGNSFNVLQTLLNNQLSTGFNGYIKVTKTGACKWVFAYKSVSSENYTILDSIIENTNNFDNHFFGIYGSYTINSKSQFFFDDFSVEAIDGVKSDADTFRINKIVADVNQVRLSLTSKIKNSTELSANNFLINSTEAFASVEKIDDSTLSLISTIALEKNKIYTLTIKHSDLCSFDANLNDSLEFAITDVPQKDDLVINEVMFNTDKVEFVEFYNTTNKMFQLRDIVWKKYSPISQIETEEIEFLNENYFIQPNSYFVFTNDATKLVQDFSNVDANNVIEVSFTPLEDDEDIIALDNIEKEELDRLKYNTNFHSGYLNATKNISLERINPTTKTQDKNNWYSANKNADHATPTKENSVLNELKLDNIGIQPEVFSPDQDGYNDVLNITYAFDSPSTFANLSIYNAEGRKVKTILRNELLPSNGFIVWDGIDDNGSKASVGIYFIIFETVETNGRKSVFKEKCVLATQLN